MANLNIALDLTEVKPANQRYVKEKGVYKGKCIDITSTADDDKVTSQLIITVTEPREHKGEVITAFLFSPLPKGGSDPKKVKTYKRTWKALALSTGIPEDKATRVRFAWESTPALVAQAKEKDNLLLPLKGKTVYVDFVPRETEDDFDEKTFITERQYRLFSAANDDDDIEEEADADEETDTEVGDEAEEDDENEEDTSTDEDIEVDEDEEVVETKPKEEPAPKRRGRPAGSKNKPKEEPAAAAAPKAPPKGKKNDPLDAADDL